MGLDALRQDLRLAARALVKRPAFAVVVLTTLALGIGAATAIFSIVDGILLKPLPFAHPDRLAFASEVTPTGRMSFSLPNYRDYRERAESFEALACHQANSFSVLDLGKPRRLNGRLACAGFFEVLGVRPALGRTFTESDDHAGASPVAMVSHRFWQQDLGADPKVIGRTLRTTERSFTIVGVLPRGFQFMRPEDVFSPLGQTVTPDSGWLDRGNHFNLGVVGRLKPGITIEHANAEAVRVAADLTRAYPNTNSGNTAGVLLLRDLVVESVEDTLVALMGAVGFLLLLAWVNVANLLVARGATRQHELSIRAALGGTRWRLIRQLLVESTLLSLVGGVLGVAVAAWLLTTLVALAPAGVPRIDEVGLHLSSLGFALAASVACGLLFGAVPAFQVSGLNGQHLLARASRTSAAVSPRRTRRGLMVVEVALALMLLAGCGLMARTMMRLNAVDPGFDPDRLLTSRVMLTGESWTLERRFAFFQDILPRLRAIPGVTSAALTNSLPIEGSNWGSIFIVGDKPMPPRAELPSAAFIPASSGYFETMRMRLLQGRTFDAREVTGSQTVTVINETLARRLWPGESAVGKRLKQGWPEDKTDWREVIGVVADVKLEGVDQETPMQAYLPILHTPVRSVALVVRTAMEPAGAASAVEAAVQAVDKDLPLIRVQPMSELMRTAVARQRLSAVILGVFAIVALLLAAVGLYGVVSHSVTERTREIGVRMALGAERGQVLRLFVGHGLATAAAGTVLGLAGAFALSRWLESLLFNVEPTDPLTFATVALLLLVVAAAACYLPARRAARVDPLLALRAE